jgi:hypothetical protein
VAGWIAIVEVVAVVATIVTLGPVARRAAPPRGRDLLLGGGVRRPWILATAAAFALACGSPGADVGNRGPTVELHGKTDPFHGTPQKAGRRADR